MFKITYELEKKEKKNFQIRADLNPDRLGERQTLYHGAIAVSMLKCSKSKNLYFAYLINMPN